MICIRTEYKTAVRKLILWSTDLQVWSGLGEREEMANVGETFASRTQEICTLQEERLV
jgi:hypothetical protein